MQELIDRIRSWEAKSQVLEPNQDLRNKELASVSNYTNAFLNALPQTKTFEFSEEMSDRFQITGQPHSIEQILDIYKREIANKGINAASGGHLGYIPGGGIFASALGDFLADVTKLVQDLPGDAENIIKKLRSGRFKVKLEHGNLEQATQTLRKSVNRLAFSVVIAGMLIGSSFMMQVEGCPRLFGFPVLGLAGYLVAGFLGLWLLIAILRSGRL